MEHVIDKDIKKYRPRIEPCGTPFKFSFHSLVVLPILTLCCRLVRYDFNKSWVWKPQLPIGYFQLRDNAALQAYDVTVNFWSHGYSWHLFPRSYTSLSWSTIILLISAPCSSSLNEPIHCINPAHTQGEEGSDTHVRIGNYPLSYPMLFAAVHNQHKDPSRRINGATLSCCYSGTIPPIAKPCFELKKRVSGRLLMSGALDMPRTRYRASEGKRSK